MAVFTPVSAADAQALLDQLQLGQLLTLQGIQGGIENTNYFVTSASDQGPQEWVLTLFERLTAQQLPFYLGLMHHLAQRGIPVPDPVARANGDCVHSVCGKPAALVNRLTGSSQLNPQPAHCAAMGAMLARMHLAARDYDGQQPNLRGLGWWQQVVPDIVAHLDGERAALLSAELAFQTHLHADPRCAALPRGAVHADIFRDNVMFDGEVLTGLFDFYFAGLDSWLFDLCVCINDWCTDTHSGAIDEPRLQALLEAYQAIRPLQLAERQLFAPMLRAAAMRFWTSRLWDRHLPRQASLLQAHDPSRFEAVLRQHIAHPLSLQDWSLAA